MNIRPSTRSLHLRRTVAVTTGLLLAGALFAPGVALAFGIPPIAFPDTVSTNEDTPHSGNVLANDWNISDSAMTVSAFVPVNPTFGTITIAANGNYTFTPAANWHGSTSTTYTAHNDEGNDTGTINITVASVNDAPVANDDTITATEDTTTGNVYAAILANDTDVDGDTLSVSAVSGSTGGTATRSGGTVTFAPTANLCGTGAGGFNYTLSDGHGATDTGHVTVNITCVNDWPTANDDTVPVTEDVPTDVTAAVLANDTDIDGDTLVVSALANEAGGTVGLDAGVVTFTPTADLCGPGAGGFDYTASDGHGGTDTAHVTVNLTCVNDDPVAGDDTVALVEDASATDVTSTILANDTDTEGDPISITGTSSASGGTADYNAGTVTFTPTANLCGDGAGGFDYDVSDGNGGTDTGHVTVDITCVNDDPVANDDTVTLNEDDGATDLAAAILSNDTDADLDTLTVTSAFNTVGGWIDLDAGPATFAPNANVCGDGAGGFDYEVSDGNGGTDTGHVTVDITCVNDDPVANDDSAAGSEDTDVVIDGGDLTANDTDVDGDPLTVSGVDNPSGGTADYNAGTVTFTPTANLCGDGAGGFDYDVSDGNGGTDTGHVTVDITCVNDDPVANDDTVTLNEDDGATDLAAAILSNDTDADLDTLTVTSAFNTVGGWIDLDAGPATFAPNANVCGDGAGGFDYEVSDGNGGTDTGHVTVDITCVNDDPVANDDTVTLNEDDGTTDLTSTILSNDTDVDGDTLSFTGISDPSGGSVDVTSGAISFTPDPNLCGDGAGGFDYGISDGNGGTDTGHVTVDISCSNDAPVAKNDSASGTEDANVVIDGGDLTANDTDADHDPLTVTHVDGATGGSVHLAGGTVTFTPDENLCGDGAGSFDYEVSDGNGGTDTGHVTVDLACANDDPVASPDTASGTEDTDVVIDAADLVADATDIDGDTLTLSGVGDATGGSVALDTDTVTFTPDKNVCGKDIGGFEYTVSDGHGGSGSAYITVGLACENDNPAAANDDVDMTEDDPATDVTAAILANDSDVDGDTLTVDDVSSITGGTVDLESGTVTYTPDSHLCGVAAAGFDYEVSDGNGGTDTAHVAIDLTCTNVAPVAVDDSASGTEDTDVVIDGIDLTKNDTDGDGDALSVDSLENVTGGTAELVGGTTTFTPDANACGHDVGGFDYVVSDGNGGTDTGHVDISLTCVNDPPVAVDDAAMVPNASGQADYDVLANDSDPEDDTLSLESASVDPGSGTASATGGKVQFTPDPAFTGIAIVTYVVSDGDLTDEGTLSVTVGPDTAPPVASAPRIAFASGRVNQRAQLRVSWSAVDVGVGVASYEVQVSVAGGPYTAVYSGPHTSIVKSYPFKKKLTWRVRATDQNGNVSGWQSTTRHIAPIQSGGTRVVYTGTWHQVTQPANSGVGYRWTSTVGAKAKLVFKGREVLYVAQKNALSGHVKVYIDGVLVGRFNLHRSTTAFGQIIAQRSWSSYGKHRIKVVDDQANRRANFDVFLVLR